MLKQSAAKDTTSKKIKEVIERLGVFKPLIPPVQGEVLAVGVIGDRPNPHATRIQTGAIPRATHAVEDDLGMEPMEDDDEVSREVADRQEEVFQALQLALEGDEQNIEAAGAGAVAAQPDRRPVNLAERESQLQLPPGNAPPPNAKTPLINRTLQPASPPPAGPEPAPTPTPSPKKAPTITETAAARASARKQSELQNLLTHAFSTSPAETALQQQNLDLKKKKTELEERRVKTDEQHAIDKAALERDKIAMEERRLALEQERLAKQQAMEQERLIMQQAMEQEKLKLERERMQENLTLERERMASAERIRTMELQTQQLIYKLFAGKNGQASDQ
jgi:hypothetical protein